LTADAITTTDSKKTTPPANSDDAAHAKSKDTTASATSDQVKTDVAANKLADPAKLQADAASTAASTVDWSKAAGSKDATATATSAVTFDNIFASTTTSSPFTAATTKPDVLAVSNTTLDFTAAAPSLDLANALTPASLSLDATAAKTPALSLDNATAPLDLSKPTLSTSALDLALTTPATSGGLDLGACTLADYNAAFGGACTVGDTSSLTTSNLLAGLKSGQPDFSLVSSLDNKTYSQLAGNMWTDKFENSLNTNATKTLNGIFDDEGDSAKVAQYKAPALDASTQSMLTAHKAGESWSADGTNFYKTDAGGLISRDKSGVHYVGADGLRFDGNHNDGTITKDGETVVKKGDNYFKQYPDGQQVQIKDKGDIAAIEKLEGMVFEQRRSALERMSPALLAKIAQEGKNDENKTVQGPDGVQVFNVDHQGDVVAKSSKEHGAFVRLKDGETFRIKDGNAYTMGPDGHTETQVPLDKLPKQFKVNPDGSITLGTVTLTKDNQWIESSHHQHMHNMEAKVTADTAHGPVVAEVKAGVETVSAPDHNYSFEPKAEGGTGKFTVTKPDGSTDLTYNYGTHSLDTDGINWSPQGIQIGDDFIGCDNSLSENRVQVWNGQLAYQTEQDEEDDEAEASDDKATQATFDADSVAADAAGEVGLGTIDFGDVASLNAEYSALLGLQGLNLDTDARAALSNQIAELESEMPAVQAQAEANALVTSLTGTSDAALTKEVAANGGGANLPDAVKQRLSLLPDLELTGDAA
jgi:hypothetical protein